MKLKNQLSRILLVTTIILLAGTKTTQAQNHQHPQKHKMPDTAEINKMIDEIAEAINLTDDQKVKMLDLHTAHFQKMEQLHQENQGNRETAQQTRQELHEEMKTALTELLTVEQQEAFHTYMQENHPHPQQGKADGQHHHTHQGKAGEHQSRHKH